MRASNVIAAIVIGAALLASHAAAADNSSTSSGSAAEQPDLQDTARAHFQRGLQLAEEGAYGLALIEFQRAYELAPSYKLLYNIGLVQMQLGKWARSMRSLRQYIEQGGTEISTDRRAEVEHDIALLGTRTAALTIRVSVPGATVELDQEVVGRSPLPTQVVDAGEHRLRVTSRGFQPYEQPVVLAGGDVSTLPVTLVPMVAPKGPKEQEGHPLPAGVWLSWAGTGLLAVGAGVCAAVALKYNSDLSTLRQTPASALTTTGQSDANLASAYAWATNILGGAAIVAAGLSTYLTVRASSTTTVRGSIGPGSVQIAGEF
jgi:hypothetical protein